MWLAEGTAAACKLRTGGRAGCVGAAPRAASFFTISRKNLHLHDAAMLARTYRDPGNLTAIDDSLVGKEAHVTTIIAGLFQQQSEAENAVEELLHAGFGRAQVSSFYVNPLGLRDVPAGKSRGAKESDRGVAMGAAAGAAVGATVAPFLGPVGAVTGGLVGAHVGGLAGSMSKMKEHGDTGDDVQDEENAAPVRHSGMLVAIGVADQQDEDRALNVLRSLGAGDIERAQGTLVDGDWSDFDPVAPPALIENLPEQPSAVGPNQRV
jgi:uncharacterized membrane protein